VVHAPGAGVSPPPPLHLFRQKETKPKPKQRDGEATRSSKRSKNRPKTSHRTSSRAFSHVLASNNEATSLPVHRRFIYFLYLSALFTSARHHASFNGPPSGHKCDIDPCRGRESPGLSGFTFGLSAVMYARQSCKRLCSFRSVG
jgi:hypothetical protein